MPVKPANERAEKFDENPSDKTKKEEDKIKTTTAPVTPLAPSPSPSLPPYLSLSFCLSHPSVYPFFCRRRGVDEAFKCQADEV